MTRLNHEPTHCPGCGRDCEVVRTVEANRIFELACDYCEYICIILAQDYIELPALSGEREAQEPRK